MPMPVSSTLNSMTSPYMPRSRRTRSCTRPPWVNLQAFESRFVSACFRRTRSARSSPSSSSGPVDEELEGVVALGGDGDEHLLELLEQRADLEVLPGDLEAAGLDLVQIQQIVDQLEQVARRGADAIQIGDQKGVLLRVGLARDDLLTDQLGVAEHGVERGAQLVGHVGQKPRLGLVGLQRLIARALHDAVELAQLALVLFLLGDVAHRGHELARALEAPPRSRRACPNRSPSQAHCPIRTSRPGRAPVSSSSSRMTWPLTNVAR